MRRGLWLVFFLLLGATVALATTEQAKAKWQGRAVLVAGTVTVSTTAVKAASIVSLTRCVAGGTVGVLQLGTVTASTSFVINSVQATTASTVEAGDTATVCWTVAN